MCYRKITYQYYDSLSIAIARHRWRVSLALLCTFSWHPGINGSPAMGFKKITLHGISSDSLSAPSSIRIRGGGDVNHGIASDVKTVFHGEVDCDENSVSSRPIKSRGSLPWSNLLPSMFELNNNVKYDASIKENKELQPFASESNQYQHPTISSSFANAAGNGRGGALVKTQATKPRRFFQWFGPLEASRAVPFSDRLLIDDNHEATAHTATANMESKSRLCDTTDREILIIDSRSFLSPKETINNKDAITKGCKDASGDDVDLLECSEAEDDALDVSPVIAVDKKSSIDNMKITNQSESTLAMLSRNSSIYQEVGQTAAESSYVSSGCWYFIDRALTAGYGTDSHPEWKISRRLLYIRKAIARVTGLHGVLSGKPTKLSSIDPAQDKDDERMGVVRRHIAAITQARATVMRVAMDRKPKVESRRFWPWSSKSDVVPTSGFEVVVELNRTELLKEKRRKRQVKEIDKLIKESQLRLQELACEKDRLQRRPNPLWNYSNDLTSRSFSFPPSELVQEYLDVMFGCEKITKLNHTDLWRSNYDPDEDEYGDDELTNLEEDRNGKKRHNGIEGSGNWLLRYGLGERIGEAVETAAYKSICNAIMSVLARGLSSIHGVSVFSHSDIRLFMEQTPDLPPFAVGIISGSSSSINNNYAQGAIEQAMRKGSKKRKTKIRSPEEDFIQRGAVVETLLSHCQISAPLLKLFPISWQRAMIGNIIILITSIMTDFFDGLQFQILGHRLSFVFSPITESDMLRRLGSSIGEGFNRHRNRPEQFEAAVRATALDLEEELNFMDRWHERALGSGMLRSQIANLIARLVLTLADDVLSGARMDLWASHAGGPRLMAGLEYR